MSNRILFVFEGEKTEKQITENLTKYFIKENIIIQCAYCTDIYKLHKELSDDDDLDVFVLLKEKPQNVSILSEYNRTDFSEIYLFFDYDGHAPLAEDRKIEDVVNFFNEETASGKLYISYPMVEALKHHSDSNDFKFKKVNAKNNIGYKHIVHDECNGILRNLTEYSKEIWLLLSELHLKKMNYIVNNNYALPTQNVSQSEIFHSQLEKYINIDSTVAVLSSFPIFLYDYYGNSFITSLQSK
ncbi:MAG TPA: hypothetical protein PLP69_02105 [Bacteroidales bacterium]|nr:hypothetical protein [Bacteroidales bacterium]